MRHMVWWPLVWRLMLACARRVAWGGGDPGARLRRAGRGQVRILERDGDGRVWALYETKQKRGKDGAATLGHASLAMQGIHTP